MKQLDCALPLFPRCGSVDVLSIEEVQKRKVAFGAIELSQPVGVFNISEFAFDRQRRFSGQVFEYRLTLFISSPIRSVHK